MKNPIFSKLLIAIIVALICIALTVSIALMVGNTSTDLIDFSELNWSNVITIIILGMFITGGIVGVILLIAVKDVFVKAKKYIDQSNKDGGKKE